MFNSKTIIQSALQAQYFRRLQTGGFQVAAVSRPQLGVPMPGQPIVGADAQQTEIGQQTRPRHLLFKNKFDAQGLVFKIIDDFIRQ